MDRAQPEWPGRGPSKRAPARTVRAIAVIGPGTRSWTTRRPRNRKRRVRVSALAAWPFIPSSAEKVLGSLGEAADLVPWPQNGKHALSAVPTGRRIAVPPLLFPKIAVADLAAAQPI